MGMVRAGVWGVSQSNSATRGIGPLDPGVQRALGSTESPPPAFPHKSPPSKGTLNEYFPSSACRLVLLLQRGSLAASRGVTLPLSSACPVLCEGHLSPHTFSSHTGFHQLLCTCQALTFVHARPLLTPFPLPRPPAPWIFSLPLKATSSQRPSLPACLPKGAPTPTVLATLWNLLPHVFADSFLSVCPTDGKLCEGRVLSVLSGHTAGTCLLNARRLLALPVLSQAWGSGREQGLWLFRGSRPSLHSGIPSSA